MEIHRKSGMSLSTSDGSAGVGQSRPHRAGRQHRDVNAVRFTSPRSDSLNVLAKALLAA